MPPQELVDQAAKDGFRLRPKYVRMKVGYVINDQMNETRIMLSEHFVFNGKYGVWRKRWKKKHFHDELQLSKLGDVVVIAPTRKMTPRKHYRLIEVLKKNKLPREV